MGTVRARAYTLLHANRSIFSAWRAAHPASRAGGCVADAHRGSRGSQNHSRRGNPTSATAVDGAGGGLLHSPQEFSRSCRRRREPARRSSGCRAPSTTARRPAMLSRCSSPRTRLARKEFQNISLSCWDKRRRSRRHRAPDRRQHRGCPEHSPTHVDCSTEQL